MTHIKHIKHLATENIYQQKCFLKQSNEHNSAFSYLKVLPYHFALRVFFVLLTNETGEDLADSL